MYIDSHVQSARPGPTALVSITSSRLEHIRCTQLRIGPVELGLTSIDRRIRHVSLGTLRRRIAVERAADDAPPRRAKSPAERGDPS
jgi:hypothetical protein